jgi:molybdate transport system ATP-binding protein
VLMADGRVEAHGPAADVLARHDLLPSSEQAEAGALVELTVVDHDLSYGLTRLRSSGGEWFLPKIAMPAGVVVRARIRARDVMLSLQRPDGISALNVVEATVVTVGSDGDGGALVTLASGMDRLFARVTRRSVDLLGLDPGKPLFAVVKAVTFDGGTPLLQRSPELQQGNR